MKVQRWSDFLTLELIQGSSAADSGLESLSEADLESLTRTLEQKERSHENARDDSVYFYFISAVLENACW